MSFQRITKEKASSVGAMIPQIASRVLSSPPEADFYMDVEEKVLFSYYIILIAIDDHILWISDEEYREKAEEFLKTLEFVTE